jgi:hypothetical protein
MGVKPGAPHMLGKCFITDLHPSPAIIILSNERKTMGLPQPAPYFADKSIKAQWR